MLIYSLSCKFVARLPSQICYPRAYSCFSFASNHKGYKNSRSFVAQAVGDTHRHKILTLLHKTTSLLPRALAPRTHNSVTSVESLEFWDNILSESYKDLISKEDRPARIAVYGVGEWSGAEALITALLEEPLNPDESQNQRIRNRWKDRSNQKYLTISHGASLGTSPSSFQTPSSYLTQFPLSLEIIELAAPTSTPPSCAYPAATHLDEVTRSILIKADVAIIICNPLTISLTTLFRKTNLIDSPNTIFILTCTPPPTTTDSYNAFTSRFIFTDTDYGLPFQHHKVLFMDPARAMEATQAFQADIRSPTALQRYQDDYVGSRVPALTAALRIALISGSNSYLDILRARTSLVQIQRGLSACFASLNYAKDEMAQVSAAVSRLYGTIEENGAKMQVLVLGRPSEERLSEANTEGDAVHSALNDAAGEMRVVLDQLTWWKMAWRVDEISHMVSQAVEKAWCHKLERQLILHTGRLTALQGNLTKSTFDLLSAHPNPPFNSAVLHNSLLQLMSSPSHALTSQSLTAPIDARRTQIIKYPTTRLHIEGQQAVLGMSAGLAVGATVSWVGWAGWLAGSGGLLNGVGMDAGTAVGIGMLCSVASVKWAVGKWERSKRRWWEDWNRVGEGLGRDLQGTLDRVLRENVFLVAKSGCNGLLELVAKRKAEVEGIEGELEILQGELKGLEQPKNL